MGRGESAGGLVEQARRAGVVGAGGAGFPAWKKLEARVDTSICNAAECEPLLFKDQELMRRYPERVVDGLRRAMRATGASRGVIAIKAKYVEARRALERAAGGDIEFHLFDSFYPAGDEVIVVHDVTGRLVPPGGIPPAVGVAVHNVETLINLSFAAEGRPVTRTAITVAGAVRSPATVVVPVGTPVREVVAAAGGAACDDPVALDGGAMMGRFLDDFDAPVTRTTGGLIVLPRDHRLARRKAEPEAVKLHVARAACDQCRMCTELCPRYLLGYAVEPHAVMRSVGFAGDRGLELGEAGLLCCECGVCDLYACPEDLPPRDMCVRSKRLHREAGRRPDPPVGLGRPHPMRDARRVPLSRLVERLGIAEWDVPAPMIDSPPPPAEVRLLLKQHVGVPARPVVRPGEAVRVGQVVAEVPEGQLGVPIHASIDGRVVAVDDRAVTVRR